MFVLDEVCRTVRNKAPGCDNEREVIQTCDDSYQEYALEEELSAKCFPNPTNGVVYIRTSIKGPFDVVVVSPTGIALEKHVLNGDESVYITHYAEGVYYLHISYDSSIVVVPVVKNSL